MKSSKCSLSLKDAFDEAVKFFGENSKTTPPSVFFPVFVRFVKAYRVSWIIISHTVTQNQLKKHTSPARLKKENATDLALHFSNIRL